MSDNSKQELGPMQVLGLRTVAVKFPGNTTRYSYFVPDSDQPKVGDVVITAYHFAEAPYKSSTVDPQELAARAALENEIDEYGVDAGKGLLSAARVVELESYANPKATKFYLMLVAADSVLVQVKANADARKNIAKRRAAVARLDELLLQQSKVDLYKRLAASNAEAAELLKALE